MIHLVGHSTGGRYVHRDDSAVIALKTAERDATKGPTPLFLLYPRRRNDDPPTLSRPKLETGQRCGEPEMRVIDLLGVKCQK